MPDHDEIHERLALLAEYTHDLYSARPDSFSEFEANKMLRRYSERMLHMAIEASISIGLGVLMREGLRSPENYRDIFVVLGEQGILPPHMVSSMTDLVEFRNLLVHQLDVVDDTMVYGALKRRLGDLEAFQHAIEAYLRGERVLDPEPIPVETEEET